MQIHLTARHCEISPETRAFAEQRLERLRRFAGDLQGAHVVVTQERHRHTAEITVRLNQQDVVITETHADPRVALEGAADRLEERLRRAKERRLEPRRGGGRDADGGPPAGTGA